MYRAAYNHHSRNVTMCTNDEWESQMHGFIEYLDTFQSASTSLAIVTRDSFQRYTTDSGRYTNINSILKANQ